MITEARLKEIWTQIIERIHGLAPNTTLSQAKQLADREVELHRRCSEAESALMVIVREHMRCNDSGYYPAEMKAIIDANPRLKWATERASYVHAGISCSPFSGGWAGFDKSIDLAISLKKSNG